MAPFFIQCDRMGLKRKVSIEIQKTTIEIHDTKYMEYGQGSRSTNHIVNNTGAHHKRANITNGPNGQASQTGKHHKRGNTTNREHHKRANTWLERATR